MLPSLYICLKTKAVGIRLWEDLHTVCYFDVNPLFIDNLIGVYREKQTYILPFQKCIYLFSFESWFFLNYWPVVKIVKKPPTRYHLLFSIFNLFQRKWNLISTQTHSNSTNENNLNVIASKTHKLQTRSSFFKNALILCSLYFYVVVQLKVNVTEILLNLNKVNFFIMFLKKIFIL